MGLIVCLLIFAKCFHVLAWYLVEIDDAVRSGVIADRMNGVSKVLERCKLRSQRPLIKSSVRCEGPDRSPAPVDQIQRPLGWPRRKLFRLFSRT